MADIYKHLDVGPIDDNAIGFHGAPGYEQPFNPLTEYPQLLAYYQDMHDKKAVRWWTLLGDGSDQSVAAARAIKEAGIEPIVRLYEERPHPNYRVDPALVARYVAVAVRLFLWGNEPNLAAEWAGMGGGVVYGHAFVVALCNQMIDCTNAINQAGGIALIPPMAPGDEMDTSGDVVCYNTVVRWFQIATLPDGSSAWAWFKVKFDNGQMGVGIHNRLGNHYIIHADLTLNFSYPEDPVNLTGEPLSPEDAAFCGVNEPARIAMNQLRLEKKNPGATLETDSTCFRSYELVDKIFFDALGYHVDLFGTEAMIEPGDQWDGRYPANTPRMHAVANIEIFRRMNLKHPQAWRSNLRCQCAWLWDLFGHGTFLSSPWRHNSQVPSQNPDNDLPAVAALEQFAATENFTRNFTEEEPTVPKASDFGIPEELDPMFQEWVAANGLYNCFMAHAIASDTSRIPNGDDLKLVVGRNTAASGELALTMAKFRFTG